MLRSNVFLVVKLKIEEKLLITLEPLCHPSHQFISGDLTFDSKIDKLRLRKVEEGVSMYARLD